MLLQIQVVSQSIALPEVLAESPEPRIALPITPFFLFGETTRVMEETFERRSIET